MNSKEPLYTTWLGYFIRSYRVTFLLILGLAILGAWTVITLPREASPEIKIPFAMVITPYPGASARDVEELVTKQVEDQVLSLSGLEEVSSSSRLGVSSVGVEFSADEDLDEALDNLKEAVDKVSGLPADAEDPTVVELNFSDEPIITISLGGVEDERLLSIFADDLAEEIEEIAGVTQVDVAGGRTEEIKVLVNPDRLAELSLNIGQLLGAIRSANINAPFGQLETEKFNYDLRIVGRFNNVGDVAAIPVRLVTGEVMPLGEIAQVKFVLSDTGSLSRVSVDGQPSTAAVTLSVRKKTGGNIIKIVDQIDEKIAEAEEKVLPEGVVTLTFADRADEIRTSLSDVYRSGTQTLAIVFVLLWLFLGWRAATITALAVPLTFSLSFLVFDQADITLNSISLFSLILSLGLLVDTVIVVVEGVYSGHHDEDLSEHAARVVNRFKKPLIGGTMTTVAAFFPMLLVSGIIGEFLRVIPIVITATLLSSLIVALAFIPAVTVRMLSRFTGRQEHERWFTRNFAKFQERYNVFIEWALGNKRFQRMFIGGLVLLLAVGLSLPFTGLLKTGLFPAVDIDFVIINVELASGSRLEQTDEVMEKVEVELLAISEVVSYAVNVGSGTSLDLGGGSSGESLGSVFVNLDKQRERSSLDIGDELRDRFRNINGAKVTVEEVSAGPPTGAPVELRVISSDVEALDIGSREIMDELAGIPGAIDIDRNLRNSAGEFNFVFDREALARFGLSAQDVAEALRLTVFGLEATTFLDDQGEEVSVRLESGEESVNTVDDVLALPLLTPTGQEIRVGQAAKVDLRSSIDAIRRVDGERTVSVSANVASGANPNEITQVLMERLDNKMMDNYRVEFGGEQQETTDTFVELYQSMIIAVILILIILVVEFNSYRQPGIIFLSIPLALIGVLFGLVITRGQLNFASFIGLVSLTGIVVNNAILLVDRMNYFMELGKSAEEAVRKAASSRLRPIILTTITTSAGVAPLIWVDEFFRDMALTLITGLLFSAILTLVLIPILYLRQQQKMERKRLRRVVSI